MARVVTAPKLALLNSAAFNFHARALIEDGDGTMRDTTNIVGVDFFDGVAWAENIDQPVASGTVSLRREGKNGATAVSIAPTMTTSPANKKVDTTYSPLIVAGRRVQVQVAWTAVGVAPAGGDWMLVFDGKIDKVKWQGLESTVSLEMRDRGGWLQNTFIEEVRIYGDEIGVPVETVMQQILDDNPNVKLGAVVLYTPTSPGWNIKKYQQDQVSVLEALSALAQQIGWDVRYAFRESSGNFELTFAEPPRTKTVSDWTLGPDHYVDVSDLNQSDENVRNRVRVRATSAGGAALTQLAVDAASIAKFGPRYMEIVEDATSNIDTQTEVDTLSDAILTDLRDPLADQEIENLPWPIAQLGDLGTWLANGKQYDTDQQFAVVQVRHEFTRDKRRTYIQSRGGVAGAFHNWLRLEGSGGGGSTDVPPNPVIGPVEVEGTARDGQGIGCMHVPVVFEPGTTQILIYATQGPNDVDDPPAPDIAETQRAHTITRQEGAIASSDTWATEVDIPTTSGFKRRIIALPVGPTGTRGNPFIDIEVCEDTGAGPTAAPIASVVTMSTVDDLPQAVVDWDNNGDNDSFVRVWRNGIVLARLDPGTITLTDTELSPGIVYSYRVQHIRNGQTSDFADAADIVSDAPVLAAPTWVAGYPRGGFYDSTEDIPPPNGLASLQFENPDPLAYTQVWMNDQDAIGGTYSNVITLAPGDFEVTLNASTTLGALTDHPRWFYLVSERPGYTSSASSSIEVANFGA